MIRSIWRIGDETLKLSSVSLLMLLALAFTGFGCNSKMARVTGRVTYADGTPLPLGQIVFTDDFWMAKANLDDNGEYSLHSLRKNDGIHKGTYRVYIVGAFRFEMTDVKATALELSSIPPTVPLIDRQYMNPHTSGWIFEIKKNSVINLTVYPPNQVPEEERTEKAKYNLDEEYRNKVKKERGDPPPKRPRLVNPKLL